MIPSLKHAPYRGVGVYTRVPVCPGGRLAGSPKRETREPKEGNGLLQHICRGEALQHISCDRARWGKIMTRRLQCGGAFLEIDPLTGELTFDDFLNALPPPEMEPMKTPKVELGPSFGVFGIPAIDNLFADIFAQLDLVTQDIDKFIAYLKKKTKDAINWGLVLAGVTTVAQVIPIVISQISGLVFRWQAFHRWEKEQKKENQPHPITDEELERKEEISELSGEDQELPSLGEVEEPLLDEGGEQVFNPDGTPATVTRVFALPRDISDDYEPIPEPPDISEQDLTPEPEEDEEDEMIKVDNKLIQDLIREFDPQDLPNEENMEFLMDSGVYIVHVKNIVMKRKCIPPGDRIAWECKMIRDVIQPAVWDRYKHTFTIRQSVCNVPPRRGIGACCYCMAKSSWSGPMKPQVQLVKRGEPLWSGNACECWEREGWENPCECSCHWQNDGAYETITRTCQGHSYGPILFGYQSDCVDFPNSTLGKNSATGVILTPAKQHRAEPMARRIIRYEDENAGWPNHTHEWCEYCKVMKKYYDTTKRFKYHKTNTDAYIFFTRGEKSTIFEKCRKLFTGIATNKEGDLLSDWDQGANKIFEYRGITCKCGTPRPTCTATYVGWASEAHTNTVAYLKGHAQRVKWIFLPDFDSLTGDPWWYADPHDYQSVSKVCTYEGFLERGIPTHVVRFFTYRRLVDKDWFPALYKRICDAVLFNYPDIPEGIGNKAKKWKDYHAWSRIDRMLSDVVPIPEIFPELARPERRLFAGRPEGWAALKSRGASWTGETEPELAPLREYLDLLNKYYPGWWAFRETHEPGWWDGFWAQIPNLEGIERTSIFLFDDLTLIEGLWEIRGEPPWWRGFWGPTIRDRAPDPERPRNYKEVLAVADKY